VSFRKIKNIQVINESNELMSFKEKYGDLSDCIFEGDLYIGNQNLNSLEGCPIEIYGSFNCEENNLTNLIGGPQKILKDFNCSGNSLKNLVGGPISVGGLYSCDKNNLRSLEGAPEKAHSFDCHNNRLETLKYAPKTIAGSLYCEANMLKDFIGGPEVIGGDCICDYNKLESFIGFPENGADKITCSNNSLSILGMQPLLISMALSYHRFCIADIVTDCNPVDLAKEVNRINSLRDKLNRDREKIEKTLRLLK